MSRRNDSGAKSFLVLVVLTSIAILGNAANLLFVQDITYSLGKLVGDDAGYYFNVARNFVLGYGTSFDRISSSNGFNPLYFIILIGSYAVFLSPDYPIIECYRVGVAASFVLLVGSVVAFYFLIRNIARKLFPGEPWANEMVASVVLIFVASYGLKQIHGLDYMASVFILGLYAYRISSNGILDKSLRGSILDGVLIGFAFLARVDSLPFVMAAYAVMMIIATISRVGYKSVIVRVICTLSVVSPYIAYGYSKYGTWMPVSASLKTGFPTIDLAASIATILHTSLGSADKVSFLLTFIISICFTGYAVMCVKQRRLVDFVEDRILTMITAFSLYLLTRLTFMILFSRFDVQGGYAAFSIPFNLLTMVYMIGKIRQHRWEIVPLRSLAIGLFVCGLGIYGYGMHRWLQERALYQGLDNQVYFAHVMNRLTTPEDVIFGGGFGIAGFLADRRWINGDGVINTYEYRAVMQSHDPEQLDRYLTQQGVTHLVLGSIENIPSEKVLHSQRLLDKGGGSVYLVKRQN